MELAKRPLGDEYTKPGALTDLSRRLSANPQMRELTVLIMYAFDRRTRLLPFLFADSRIIPAGVRAVADGLDAAGLTRSRIVFQLWSPNVRPSRALIDGRLPDILMVSSMQIHAREAYKLVADALTIPEDKRPLILCGGPKSIYEPWDYFAQGERGEINADVAVTGESYVLFELLERLLEHKSPGETMRQAFLRARKNEALHDIPGLVYRVDPPGGGEAHLIDTGIQKLVQYLDELPMPLAAFSKLEPPHRGHNLSRRPVSLDTIHKRARITSLIITQGCKFRCSYCPIPAYNQNSFRFKSPERLGDEMTLLQQKVGLRNFFGTDDNFLNRRETFTEIYDHLATRTIDGRRFNKRVRWATEATIHDAYNSIDTFAQARRAGLRALWFGVEDLTATVVKKGQAGDKTEEVFHAMNENGLCPMPMMMHHDGQPLYTRNSPYGLMNQVHYLRKAGAISMQITALTPAVGTNFYDTPYRDGLVFKNINHKPVDEAHFDGNHVVASNESKPWLKQFNLIAGYATFYNPLSLLGAIFKPKRRLSGADVGMQVIGMAALAKTAVDSAQWAWRLWRGPIEPCKAVPGATLRVVKVRPDEIETKRPTAIPPDSREVYKDELVSEPNGTFALPIAATP
ncbi:MAG: radical SAM protein [Planctomycetota bacterium]|nr:radical SAM protein [Planctomycetota bacterium]